MSYEHNTVGGFIGAAFGALCVLSIPVLYLLATRAERRERRELALAGMDATATIASVKSVAVNGSQIYAICEVDVRPSDATYRDSVVVSVYRLHEAHLYVPVLWLPRFQPGLELRARVHPTRLDRLQLFLGDGPGGQVSWARSVT